MKIKWLRMEQRIREVLQRINQRRLREDSLRDALTVIDEIVAHETGRGHELSPRRLSEPNKAAEIQRREWEWSVSD